MEFISLTKQFGGLTVLRDFSLSLPGTGTVALFGPSGSGKTTLLRLAAGLETPDSGEVRGTRGKKTGYVFQEHRLFPWMTAEENVAAVLPPHATPSPMEWLRRVGVSEAAGKRPGQLSGGMRKRVSLARALAFGGDLLLLDEPLQGLDHDAAAALCRVIRQYNRAALTLLVTHNPSEVRMLADTVVTFQGPPLVATGQYDGPDFAPK